MPLEFFIPLDILTQQEVEGNKYPQAEDNEVPISQSVNILEGFRSLEVTEQGKGFWGKRKKKKRKV